MIHVNFGGCDSNHPPGSIIENSKGNQDYLIVITKSDAIFEIKGQRFETPTGTVVLFDKDVAYRYWNNNSEYINDWLHFNFYDETPSFNDLSIPLNQVLSLNNLPLITLITNQIIKELYSSSSNSQKIIDSFMRILLLRISEQIRTKDDPNLSHHLYPQMRDLRTSIYNFPGEKWTVKKMSSAIHISDSYFQHLYKDIFGISCINDVINARIESAKFHLKQTNISIRDLSEMCGYENVVHFSRQFKIKTGLSPREYRNKLTADDYTIHNT